MSKARYLITKLPNGQFDLFEDGTFLVRFTRTDFRNRLDSLGRGRGWIGSILRLLNKTHPVLSTPSRSANKTPLERLLQDYGESWIVKYLQAKGYRVYKPVNISDLELINALITRGYTIEVKVTETSYPGKSSSGLVGGATRGEMNEEQNNTASNAGTCHV